MCLAALARTAAGEGRFTDAATLYGAAPDPVTLVGILLAHTEDTDYKLLMKGVRARLGDAAWQAAFHRGGAFTLEQATEFALES
jgi:hypothetical protein